MEALDKATVLVIDDERNMREMLEIGLAQYDFVVRCAADGVEGLAVVQTFQPDIIVLDIMMPKIDGVSLVPLLRRHTEAPIVMLSARSDAHDKIAALTAGADDYVAKPFHLGEVAARLRAQLRRPQLLKRDFVKFEDITVDVAKREVLRAGKRVDLTAREFDLLVALLREPGRVFTREQLLDRVWGSESAVEPSVVETYISYLRTKLADRSDRPIIRTIRRVGYTARPND